MFPSHPIATTEAMLQAHGFSIELIRDGLATATVERLGRPAIEVTRVMITNAGRASW